MTTAGGDSFQVGPDSVVAKLSVDVPAGSADELHQVNQQAEQLKVNLEAVARAQSSWLTYLQQVPALTEQAAQAQRTLITQLERTAYVQQEIGGYAQPSASGTPAPSSPQQYSTAAPHGYVNPFSGSGAGMGMGMGAGGAQAAMSGMMMNDPRMFANMLAQRGMNPATLGMVGQAAMPGGTGGMGMGVAPPASMSSQATNAARDSASPPDSTQMGQGTKSEPQNIPETPHPDAPMWQRAVQQVQKMGQSVVNETRGGGGRGSLLGMAGAGAAAIANRAKSGGGSEDGDPSGGMLKGMGGAGVAGGMITAALGVNKLVQNAGEQIQQYRNLGGERGGGAVEGAGYEMQARMMAMNPFITLEQSRQIMQTGLRSGYTGKEFETVTQMMAQNLKDMNMSAADSMQQYNDTVRYGGESIQDFKRQMKDLHDLSATGFVGKEEKIKQRGDTSNVLGELGFSGNSLAQMTNTMVEGFADNAMLSHSMPGALNQAVQNPLFMTYLGRAGGVTGLPDEIPDKLQEQGPGASSAALTKLLRENAQKAHASSPNDEPHAAAIFKAFNSQMGLNLPYRESKELYRFVMGGGDPAEFGKKRVEDARGRQTIGEQIPGTKVAEDLMEFDLGKAWKDLGNMFDDGPAPSETAEFGGAPQHPEGGRAAPVGRGSNAFAPQGRAAPALPNTPSGGGGTQQTQGTVQGELRVVVDQEGRLKAPETVRLSGNQIAVNAGYGGATLNNPSPGDQNYLHNNRGMG